MREPHPPRVNVGRRLPGRDQGRLLLLLLPHSPARRLWPPLSRLCDLPPLPTTTMTASAGRGRWWIRSNGRRRPTGWTPQQTWEGRVEGRGSVQRLLQRRREHQPADGERRPGQTLCRMGTRLVSDTGTPPPAGAVIAVLRRWRNRRRHAGQGRRRQRQRQQRRRPRH